MDATTTHSIHSLIRRLKTAHPQLTFEVADEFLWSPDTNTIFYNPSETEAANLLLHELSHALLEHKKYSRDVELVAMETSAWDEAKRYADSLPDDVRVEINDDVAQNHLDTYREWLHARSTCPKCSATGFQIGPSTYSCPACARSWRVNEARICALRRYSLQK